MIGYLLILLIYGVVAHPLLNAAKLHYQQGNIYGAGLMLACTGVWSLLTVLSLT